MSKVKKIVTSILFGSAAIFLILFFLNISGALWPRPQYEYSKYKLDRFNSFNQQEVIEISNLVELDSGQIAVVDSKSEIIILKDVFFINVDSIDISQYSYWLEDGTTIYILGDMKLGILLGVVSMLLLIVGLAWVLYVDG